MRVEQDLINFPAYDDKPWSMSGDGGGQHVAMVVPMGDDFGYSEIHLRIMGPDCPTYLGEGIFPEDDEDVLRDELAIHKALKDAGHERLAIRTAFYRDLREMSYDLLACVLLGSSAMGYWDKREKVMWHAQYEDLTEAGKDLWNRLHAAFGIEPQLITLLDT